MTVTPAGVIEEFAGTGRARRPALVESDGQVMVLFESNVSGATQIGRRLVERGLAPTSWTETLTRSSGSALWPAGILRGQELLLAWIDTRHGEGSTQVYFGTWDAGGRLVAEHPLSRPGLAAAPALAALADGRLLIAWHELIPEPIVKLAIAGPEGAPAALSADLGRGAFPSIAAIPAAEAGVARTSPVEAARGVARLAGGRPRNARALVAWHGSDGAIRTAIVDTARGGAAAAWPHPGAFPRLAPRADGSVAMLWWSPDPAPGMRVAAMATDGRIVAGPRDVGAATSTPTAGSLVATRQGIVACWAAPGDPGRSLRVNAVRLDDDLSPVGAPVPVFEGKPEATALVAAGDDVWAAVEAPTAFGHRVSLVRIRFGEEGCA